MAYVKKNIVTEGLSGKLGNNIVFRNVGGKTVVAVKPDTSNRQDSEAQKYQKRRFKAGSTYAVNALQDPLVKESYALRTKPGQTPYNVALADFLNAPVIEEVNLSTFSGAKGSPIRMLVVDDHEVTEVKVAIYDPQGGLVEEGNATLHENGIDWVYTTQKALATVSGSSIFIQASDLPGNTVEREEVLS